MPMNHCMPRLKRARGRFCALGALKTFSCFILPCLLLSGCAWFSGGASQGAPDKDPRSAYVLAVDSYLAGQYEKAASIFQRLSGNPAEPVVARKAYYGLACARLATARTPAELHEALNLWNTWVQMTPEGLPSEDPRLLTPLLPRLTLKAGPGNPAMLSDEEIEAELARSKRLVGCQEETGKVKEALRKKTFEAEALRSQLNALERLHQEISQRKKGLE
jgi:hypothetical protein